MIKRIRFDVERLQGLGLKTQELVNLGTRVVLAGPNGGGKTRYLKAVQSQVDHAYLAHRQLNLDGIVVWPPNSDVFKALESTALSIDDTTGGKWLHTVMIRYRPDTVPVDPEMLSQREFNDHLSKISAGEYDAIASGLHVYLEATARALWNGRHPSADTPDINRDYNIALRFNEALQELLGTTVEPEVVNNSRIVPRIFGQKFKSGDLSAGQHVLLCWAILLLRQEGHYRNKIVLIDEPEVYLHPDACARAIASLQRLLGNNGQVWIATHSLPLIAWAGVDSLHFVQDGEISFAGTTPSRVWSTLLGGEATRERLLSFLDGDAAAAASRFAAECLLQPGVVSARPDDPQTQQFISIIKDRLHHVGVVRALEIGAGRGRLVAAITELLRGASNLHPEHLTYVAYEDPRFVDAEHQRACKGHLDALRALGAHVRYSTSFAELQAMPDERADVVVLANTLHEVPVEDWLRLFDDIRRSSKPDANLLVIEDQVPRLGELPHPRGFLILEENEWSALVGTRIRASAKDWKGRRLTAFEIPIALLANAKANLSSVLELVVRRAMEEIRRLRHHTDNSHRAGHHHAFLAMLHLNATMALEIFGAD